ncbi:shikimate dehydrogenase [Agromyces sp. SYSU K20354]|uniref:shikimate dehydrogenase n=1 Tax=Agromyces cavernae TaxID=2898659 RepID=UPI001E4AB3C7|nr:shikimate dehydrogenase [Agromyces cavernae]MCD2442307.1 shikimate dehydrogenase [Agromyces cavernae]
MRRLAVLGSPIGHSQSPALHRAAYARLGLDWEYTAIEMDGSRLGGFIDGLDASWRGLSLTMPLKQDVLPMLDHLDDVALFTGAANTVVFDEGSRRGFNTDIGGIVGALAESDVHRVARGAIVGAGATALSALVAMAELGAGDVRVLVRRPGAAQPVLELGRRLGVRVDEAPISALAEIDDVDLVISTLPGSAGLDVVPDPNLASTAPLLDVAYDPWPTAIGASWLEAGGRVVHGLGMLLHQALLQVRIFVNGDPHVPLDDEADVLAVMRDALR